MMETTNKLCSELVQYFGDDVIIADSLEEVPDIEDSDEKTEEDLISGEVEEVSSRRYSDVLPRCWDELERESLHIILCNCAYGMTFEEVLLHLNLPLKVSDINLANPNPYSKPVAPHILETLDKFLEIYLPRISEVERKQRRPKKGAGFSYLDLTNIYIIRPQSNAGEYLVAQMYVGPFGRVRAPRPIDHVLNPPPGYFGVYPMSFAKGIRFPLHPFITEYLDMVGLTPALLTPNSYSLIVRFLLRCAELNYKPTTALFMNLYQIGRGNHKNCACYATLALWISLTYLN
ncbi:unnamed protein product [Cuscuta europaea]|uniref:Transposase (putative) gypsy type domain-containing protein n=1 Tax=Cuscuta europaea TaxID=41803 RepID=A0A9P0YWL9_CUSEU|nr:unnamed protein product [Cuscuta europaea]